MESGNSSSMQSEGASGGDDQAEYDSRSLFQLPSTIPPPLPPPASYHQPDLFTWEPVPASLLRPSDHADTSSYLSFSGAAAGPSSAPAVKQPPPKAPPGPAKNPKKRTRASRRAPTTVLTTDTSNFRAMVQEFTGIPDPPFSSSSRRLDAFSTAGSSMRQLATPFRPAPQRPVLMNQGSGFAPGVGLAQAQAQPDPTSLAFERLIHQHQQPQPLPAPYFMGGLDPSGVGVGLGFGSSPSPPTDPGNAHPRPG